ncbi:uncharacterized protein N7458_011242 [Penicillium daleae]|uniref:Uncharacterized protein n=1 Tax=Penicillium daleae TaxID=63821 RepID=A0AAD6C357_9EURO|nr:uncharacterized protein N7458_011242 [Penicillium daleae]KAJ5440244.1 hypothetical protein N7458_011242 [Penicillium daleae]
MALDNNKRIKHSASEMQKLMDNKELFLESQASDQDIQTRSEALNSSIKTWSVSFMRQKEDPVFHKKWFSAYLDIAPSCQVTQHLERFPVATQSSETPPPPESLDLWLRGVERKSLDALEMKLFCADPRQMSPRAFSDWRAFTVGLLSKTNTDARLAEGSIERINTSVQDVMILVEAWAQPAKLQYLEDDLCAIFLEAVELSRILRRQRWLWASTACIPSEELQTSVGREVVRSRRKTCRFLETNFVVSQTGGEAFVERGNVLTVQVVSYLRTSWAYCTAAPLGKGEILRLLPNEATCFKHIVDGLAIANNWD